MLNIAIQIINITWNKSSRGAPNATKRNEIPRAFLLEAIERDFKKSILHPLNHSPANSLNIIEHHSFYNNYSNNKFIRSKVERNPLPKLDNYLINSENKKSVKNSIKGLMFGIQDEKLIIYLNTSNHGFPIRHPLIKIRTIGYNETLQLSINGRHSDCAHWYTQTVFNIAYKEKTKSIPANIFIDKKTTGIKHHVVSLEENLF